MPALSRSSLPEHGQLVDVRQRRYVVTEVRQSTLPPTRWPPTIRPLVRLVAIRIEFSRLDCAGHGLCAGARGSPGADR